MSTITISPKYQIVIPKSIREGLDLRPGQKIEAMMYDGRIELVPVRSIAEIRGAFPGIDTDVLREPDRF